MSDRNTTAPKTTPNAPTSRRRFLRGALGAGLGLLAARCTPDKAPAPQPSAPPPTPPPAPAATPPTPAPPQPPSLPDGLNAALFHLHTQQPLTLELRRGALGMGVLTPMSRFFVRNNLPMPDPSILANPDAWTLQVEGVATPKPVTVADLKRLGHTETVATVLQCSGNGRQFFKHSPSGSQWGTGASGCAIWTGVPVRKLAEALGGPAKDARYMTSTGGDPLPKGVDPLKVMVERSIPLDKALQDCLLAWEMNGQPIPLTHGGPLRLIVPGYYGCNQIKYIRKLAFTKAQTQAKIQNSGYRFRPIGAKGNPSQPSMWAMNLKSWVVGPGAEDAPVLQGPITFHGVAFSNGASPVKTVEVSTDDGKTWKPARWVGPDLGPYAWRNFAIDVTLPAGAYRVASRATDADGKVQPEQRVENERGYGNNSWRDMTLNVQVVATLPDPKPATPTPKAAGGTTASAAPAQPVALSDKGKRGRDLFTKTAEPSCTACHTLADAGATGAVGPNLNDLGPDAARVTQAVTNGVGAMPAYKDTLTAEQISDLATYIAEATAKAK